MVARINSEYVKIDDDITLMVLVIRMKDCRTYRIQGIPAEMEFCSLMIAKYAFFTQKAQQSCCFAYTFHSTNDMIESTFKG